MLANTANLAANIPLFESLAGTDVGNALFRASTLGRNLDFKKWKLPSIAKMKRHCTANRNLVNAEERRSK